MLSSVRNAVSCDCFAIAHHQQMHMTDAWLAQAIHTLSVFVQAFGPALALCDLNLAGGAALADKLGVPKAILFVVGQVAPVGGLLYGSGASLISTVPQWTTLLPRHMVSTLPSNPLHSAVLWTPLMDGSSNVFSKTLHAGFPLLLWISPCMPVGQNPYLYRQWTIVVAVSNDEMLLMQQPHWCSEQNKQAVDPPG